jgi:hypothetical protein
VARVAGLRLPVYAALSYDGVMGGSLHCPKMRGHGGIQRHQRGDKGFGPALGPRRRIILQHKVAGGGLRGARGG